MARRLLDPNSLAAQPSPERIREALVSIWYLVSEAPITVTVDYTTSGEVAVERLVGTNSEPVTVFLHNPAEDGDEIWIKRQNALITVKSEETEGTKNTIDGADELIFNNKYDAARLVYNEAAGEWSNMTSLSFNQDSEGKVLVSSPETDAIMQELTLQIKLLNERIEEAFETNITEGDVDP